MGFYLTTPEPAVSEAQPRKPESAYPRPSGVGSGLRFYKPGMGRWINRDPIGEADIDPNAADALLNTVEHFAARDRGSYNSYLFLGNSGINLVDILGLIEWKSYVRIGYNPDGLDVVYSPLDPESRERSSARSSEQFAHNLYVHDSLTYCNTPSDMYIQAREPCCRKYRITCAFMYLGVARGEDFARVRYIFSVPDGNVCDDDLSVGYNWDRAELHKTKSCSAVMEIGPAWTVVGRLFPNITMSGGGYLGAPDLKAKFSERGSISCSAEDLGSCN